MGDMVQNKVALFMEHGVVVYMYNKAQQI